jgi:hypothetical protein
MEPKLLTEAEWREMSPYPKEYIEQELRERGLIAAEPVDPLLVEAREIASTAAQVGNASTSFFADTFRKGKSDDHNYTQIALAALRRGIEIGAERLTREMVREAYFNSINMDGVSFPDRIYAALTEIMNGEAA